MRSIFMIFISIVIGVSSASANDTTKASAITAMRKAAEYFRETVARQGGYVYHYSEDLTQRYGEGEAGPEEFWVQPPGTPTVGMAFLNAYHATDDRYYLEAATEAAEALLYGQLPSGGWANSVDQVGRPKGLPVTTTKKGKKNRSSLDDDQTQSALRFLMSMDAAYEFKHQGIHAACKRGLEALLNAQFANGGFPQGWVAPVTKQPVIAASYPDYDWRTEGKIKNYWDYYTLNDDVCSEVVTTLALAWQTYEDERYREAVRKVGEFFLLAQMPEPQPAWAQQYNYQMHPMWARRFEPPAISSHESYQVLLALLTVTEVTGDKKYLEPYNRTLPYLKRSRLKEGNFARFYELKTNKPLYMIRKSKKVYELTYDDTNLPTHYGFKSNLNLDKLEKSYATFAKTGKRPIKTYSPKQLHRRATVIIKQQDAQGRWMSTFAEKQVGDLKLAKGDRYLSSEVFCKHMDILSRYVVGSR